MVLLIGTSLFLGFAAFLTLMWWEAVKPTKASRSYMAWLKEDQAIRRAVTEEWQKGNWS